MYKLILFVKRIATPLLFLIIEVAAIVTYTSSTSLTRARLLTISNEVTGSINSSFSAVGDYFGLRRENDRLTRRIVELESLLSEWSERPSGVRISSEEIAPYLFGEARVIKNSVFSQNNFFTIDKGLRDDVEANMAVLTPEGYVAGYVIDCSERFAVCMSVANRDFTMGGKGKGNDYMGSVAWDGDDYHEVSLDNIPHYADFAPGDTIVSTVSYRFPPDRVIGYVEEFSPSSDKMNSHLRVRLAADLSRLDRVLLVKYMDGEELRELESKY
ncbi:MAG: rod shape-determining protein MreC [Tidjanibacter sp.]|nr:rod shape-determining protein MreC [Tidjanibacter sp.]MBQ2248307.1 rod shape-determining protein MreC [Tidjanibacter sp.]